MSPSLAAFQAALQHQQAGRLEEAAGLYQQMLAGNPDYAPALHYLGLIRAQTGQMDEACRLLRRAAQLAPREASFHFNLGLVLQSQNRLEEAAACFKRTIELKPEHGRACYALGIALKDLGQLQAAQKAFVDALRLEPRHVAARVELAAVLMSLARPEEAVAHLRQVIAIAPNDAQAHNYMGIALHETGQTDSAMAAWRRAISLSPDYAQPHVNLGLALQQRGDLDGAIEQYETALRIQPDVTYAHNNLAMALHAQGRIDEALDCYRTAIGLNPNDPVPHSGLIWAMHMHPRTSLAQLAEEHDRWVQRHAAPLMRQIRPHLNDQSPDRRLRIGYVSPDFRKHVVGWMMLPILTCHDRRAFEIVCYSDYPRPDEQTAQLKAQVDLWRDTAGLSHGELAERIREDRIDILVDLALHLSGNRLATFARKPALVQVSYLGYAASTGLPTIDYRITDPNMDPPGQENFGPEQLIRLPDCYWVYRAPPEAPPVQPPPMLRNGHVTFGSFNAFNKVNDEVLALWGQLMQRVPDSRLLIIMGGGQRGNDRVRRMLAGHGVAEQRVRFSPTLAYAGYLRLYNEIDISLDSFPYNGGITGLDAMWMGVPVVTLAGDRAVSRAGLTLLTNLKLTDLIARTPEDYIRIASALAADSTRLVDLRATLRDRMRSSPLLDEVRFTRNLEDAYRQMWRRWCERPRSR